MDTNDFRKVGEDYSRADHEIWGPIEILSQYQNSFGRELLRVRLLDGSDSIRYTDPSNLVSADKAEKPKAKAKAKAARDGSEHVGGEEVMLTEAGS
jgi:hypothetical protein